MGINYIIYLIETIVAVITILVGIVIFEGKHKKGYLKFFGITLLIYIVILGLSFIFEKPNIKIKDTLIAEVKEEKVELPSAQYHFQDISDKVRINGNIDYNKIGEYEVELEVDTLIGTYKQKTKVNVIDSKKPEILLEGEEEYNQSYSRDYEDPGYKAIDEYEGDITDRVKVSKIEINETKFNIKYEVEDSSGNKAEKERHITIVDDIPPNLTLNGSYDMTIYLNGKYEEKGAKAEDEKDGDLTDKISVEGSVDTSKEGTYTITYKVSDLSGNESKEERKVKVIKKVEALPAQSGSNKGVIYLTFDDGPSSNITPKVLDILKQKGVKATFFILNYGSEGEKLVQREYNEGHTIGIHGYSHEYSEIYKSEDAYMANITKLQEKIKKSTGYNATITRFPGGSSNTVSRFNPGIMSRLTRLVTQKGYRYFDWNVSSGDAGGTTTSEGVYNNVINGLSKSKQNVVLMHDFGSNTKLLGALGDIIDYGKANGYTFSRITESTPMVTHGVNN